MRIPQFQARRAIQTWLLTLLVGTTPLIAAETAPPAVAAEPAVTTVKSEPRVISVDLQLSPELQQYQHQSWTLYLYAKPLDSRVPVASKKITLDQLPQRLELTEQDFLLPHLTLAGPDQVVVAVKVSRINSPHETLAGDLVGKSPVVDFTGGNQQELTLLIDEEVQ
ncbi:MAG: hypothetical protein V7707_12830 [Motiliproteus sp.]